MPRNDERSAPTRRLQLVANADAGGAARAPEPARVRSGLAVWPLECAATKRLPRELARQLITHYSDIGDLVLAAPDPGTTLAVASELGRRALPLAARTQTSAAVTALRADERATLAIACLQARASARTITALARRLCEQLAVDGFVVLALDGGHGPLGPIVRACQKQRLQYWQHVIAIDPRRLSNQEGDDAASDAARSLRCHRDLLVFRRPAQADATAREAARAEAAAA